MMADAPILDIRAGDARESAPGVHVWTVSGEQMTLNYVELQPGAVTRLDQHANEQINYVLSGRVEVQLGPEGEIREVLGPGGTVVIPSNVQHRFRVAGHEPAAYLGVISPARPAMPRA